GLWNVDALHGLFGAGDSTDDLTAMPWVHDDNSDIESGPLAGFPHAREPGDGLWNVDALHGLFGAGDSTDDLTAMPWVHDDNSYWEDEHDLPTTPEPTREVPAREAAGRAATVTEPLDAARTAAHGGAPAPGDTPAPSLHDESAADAGAQPPSREAPPDPADMDLDDWLITDPDPAPGWPTTDTIHHATGTPPHDSATEETTPDRAGTLPDTTHTPETDHAEADEVDRVLTPAATFLNLDDIPMPESDTEITSADVDEMDVLLATYPPATTKPFPTTTRPAFSPEPARATPPNQSGQPQPQDTHTNADQAFAANVTTPDATLLEAPAMSPLYIPSPPPPDPTDPATPDAHATSDDTDPHTPPQHHTHTHPAPLSDPPDHTASDLTHTTPHLHDTTPAATATATGAATQPPTAPPNDPTPNALNGIPTNTEQHEPTTPTTPPLTTSFANIPDTLDTLYALYAPHPTHTTHTTPPTTFGTPLPPTHIPDDDHPTGP
ncbi:hypothetical protein AB0O11_38330, partial [Kitasatospora sp. NPDC093102]